MEAKELRLGNWVMHDSMYNKVIGLNEEEIIIDCFPRYAAKPAAFNPIPITPETLEKAGFQISSFSGDPVLLDLDGTGVGLAFNEDGTIYPAIDIWYKYKMVDYPFKVESIHQLQNLYFALTGEELTIEL